MIWIETKYHGRRRQRTLGKLTPVEFETIYVTTALARLENPYPECQQNRGQSPASVRRE